MIYAECIPPGAPREVRFTGPIDEMRLLQDGLLSMQQSSIAAEAGGSQFAYSPDETRAANTEWQTNCLQSEPEVRVVSPWTAAIAYRGLVLNQALLERDRAVQGIRDNDQHSPRRHAIARTLGHLAPLRSELTEYGFLPPARRATRPDAG